jgi:hypothetical protein
MIRGIPASAAAICVALCTLLIPISARADSFEFVALGDTGYNLPQDYPVYQALIERINSTKPAFSIHVGDTWGVLNCSQVEHERIQDFFAQYNHPVVYTPGDNEWVDCAQPEVVPPVQRFVNGTASPEDMALILSGINLEGGFERRLYADGLTSLGILRATFFGNDQSLGQNPITLTRQADVSDFKDMVENAIWSHAGVLFGTVHVPGSANNFFINDQSRALEAIARNRANVDWIKQIFARASADDAKAVVIALHASLFVDGSGGNFTGQTLRGGENGPFRWIVQAIRDLGSEFARPVLVIHGDFHEFEVDRPFLVSGGEAVPPKYANITRLQVYGAPEIKAVTVSVDTDTPWVFGFSPLHN